MPEAATEKKACRVPIKPGEAAVTGWPSQPYSRGIVCTLAVKLSELSKSHLPRYVARGFIDTGVIEIKGGDDDVLTDIMAEDMKQVEPS